MKRVAIAGVLFAIACGSLESSNDAPLPDRVDGGVDACVDCGTPDADAPKLA